MSPASKSYYKRYRDVVKKISGQNLDEDSIYQNFTEGAYRVILSIKNEDTRTDALSYVSECLHHDEKVSDRDLRGWLKVWKIEHGEPEKLTNVNPVTPDIDVKPEVPIQSLAQLAQDRANKAAEEITGIKAVSPFQTAAQVMQHDKDPLGVNQMFAPIITDTIIKVSPNSDTPKTEKELFMDACQSAYEHGKPDFKLAIDELMRYHPSWKDAGTVIYFCVTDPKEAARGRKG